MHHYFTVALLFQVSYLWSVVMFLVTGAKYLPSSLRGAPQATFLLFWKYQFVKQVLAESFPLPCEVSTCSLPLTPVMTAEDPWDTSNREKSIRKKDLMIKSCLCAPVPSRVKSEDAEADGPCWMCICERLQRRVASKLLCFEGLAEVYKPSLPFRNSVTHSYQHCLAVATQKRKKKTVQGRL